MMLSVDLKRYVAGISGCNIIYGFIMKPLSLFGLNIAVMLSGKHFDVWPYFYIATAGWRSVPSRVYGLLHASCAIYGFRRAAIVAVRLSLSLIRFW